MQPFLKWAGGKRWLFSDEFVRSLPDFVRYVEPFLGGGAGFFKVSPSAAALSDLNPELVNAYLQVRNHPDEIARGLKMYQTAHTRDFYYDVRQRPYTPDTAGAVRTIYLNRTCWNGLYRLNMRGTFNVPIGTKSKIFDQNEDWRGYAKLLENADLKACDFETTVDRTQAGDLLFVDPPYTVKHNVNGFIKYNEAIFSWADQIRLRDAVARALERNVNVILTNADHSSVWQLYVGLGVPVSVTRQSVISGNNKGRSVTSEILLRA